MSSLKKGQEKSTYLSLHHMVALRSQHGHVAVYVDCILMFESLQHGVDNDETRGTTNTSTEKETKMM